MPSCANASCTMRAVLSWSSTTSARAPCTEGRLNASPVSPSARAVSPRMRHSSSSRFSRTSDRTRASNVSYSTGLVRKSSGAGLQPAQPLRGFSKCGDHHHGYVQGLRRLLQAPTGLVAVHFRHHDIEQDQVGLPASGQPDALGAVVGGGDLVIFGAELRLQQAHVGGNVVDDEDPGRHASRYQPSLRLNNLHNTVCRADTEARLAPGLPMQARCRMLRCTPLIIPLVFRSMFGMSPRVAPTAWTLAEDKAGMLSQAIGLAEAVGLRPDIRLLRPRGLRSALTPALWWSPLSAIDPAALAPPITPVVIGCGGMAGRGAVGVARPDPDRDRAASTSEYSQFRPRARRPCTTRSPART